MRKRSKVLARPTHHVLPRRRDAMPKAGDTYEVRLIGAKLSKKQAVLARVVVDGVVLGTTSKRRRVLEPTWDRTFAVEVDASAKLETKIFFLETVSARSSVGFVELDGRALCAEADYKDGTTWRGWVKETATVKFLRHRLQAEVEVRLVKPGEALSARATPTALEDGSGNDEIHVEVARARALIKETRFRSTDAYCQVYYDDALLGVSRVVRSSQAPEWGGSFRYALSHGGRPCSEKNRKKKLVVRVMNFNRGGEDSFLGEVSIPRVNTLGDIHGVTVLDKEWYALQGDGSGVVVAGDVQVRVAFLAAFENDEQAYFEHYADPELRALKLLSDLWDDCDEEHDGVLTEDQFVALFRKLASENASVDAVAGGDEGGGDEGGDGGDGDGDGGDEGPIDATAEAKAEAARLKLRDRATREVRDTALPAPDWKQVADTKILTFADARRVLDLARRKREHLVSTFRVTRVTVHRGLNLVPMDGAGFLGLVKGSSDPYVQVVLGGALLCTTPHVEQSLNPVFDIDVACDLLVTGADDDDDDELRVISRRDDDDDEDADVLRLDVFDKDKWSADDSMGSATVHLGAVLRRVHAKNLRERRYSVAAAPARSRDVLRRWFDVLPTATCATATGQLDIERRVACWRRTGRRR